MADTIWPTRYWRCLVIPTSSLVAATTCRFSAASTGEEAAGVPSFFPFPPSSHEFPGRESSRPPGGGLWGSPGLNLFSQELLAGPKWFAVMTDIVPVSLILIHDHSQKSATAFSTSSLSRWARGPAACAGCGSTQPDSGPSSALSRTPSPRPRHWQSSCKIKERLYCRFTSSFLRLQVHSSSSPSPTRTRSNFKLPPLAVPHWHRGTARLQVNFGPLKIACNKGLTCWAFKSFK